MVAVMAATLGLASACGGSSDEPAGGATGTPTSSTGVPPTPNSTPPTASIATVDPANFVPVVDNPYFPLVPGTVFRYEGTSDEAGSGEGHEVDVVEVTNDTKTILGVPAVVVRDTVTLDGQLVEDTYDWYAQDRDGNVWYMGEDTKEYEDGQVVSTAGSWEGGVDGAQPGVVMQARPQVGLTYQQEYYAGEAEDTAEILSIDEQVTVPYGSFDQVVQTRDFTPLEPDLEEQKFYARGVGAVMTLTVKGGSTRLELVTVTKS
jgi:hypothetical protein